VFKTNLRPMSSVTLAIVACVFRASGPSPASSPAGCSATSFTIRHTRRRKRAIPSTPSSVHYMS